MTRVVLSPKAQDDSDGVLSSLARDAGPQVAERYARRLDRLCVVLTDHPDVCPARPELGLGVRMGVVSPYLVFYRHDAESGTVTILRIVHGRRDIGRRLVRG